MPQFEANQAVYAYHGHLLYKAKVLAVQQKAGGATSVEYRLHYDGWNRKWDEWVPADRVLPINDSTTELKKKLTQDVKAKSAASAKAANAATKKRKAGDKGAGAGAGAGASAGAGDGAGAGASAGKKSKKRKATNPEDELEDPDGTSVLSLTLGYPLKKALVDDWEKVNQRQCLATLPRKFTVSDILGEYLASKKQRNVTDNIFVEIVEGLRLYFDRALGAFLLYRFERPQFETLVASEDFQEKPMSDVYGVEHLLRLFIKLPYFLAQSSVTDADIAQLEPRLNEFLQFLKKNLARFQTHDYQVADADYVAKVKKITKET